AVAEREDLGRPRAAMLAGRGCFSGFAAFRLYEDSHADVWIGTIQGDTTRPMLFRWRRATGAIECFRTASFLEEETGPTAFLDDGGGALWIGFYWGQVARYRNGRFVCLIDCTNPSQGNITGMVLDHRRRLWIATNRAGVLRLDNIASEHPIVTRLTTNDGLTSNRTRAVLEDRFGRIYIGTDLGIDVLEADGRRMRHYGVDDGLPHPFINMPQPVDSGDLWSGTLNGAARLQPTASVPIAGVPRIVIDGIRVAGVPRPVAASGEPDIGGMVLAPDQRNLEVDFVALPRGISRTLRFQYRL